DETVRASRAYAGACGDTARGPLEEEECRDACRSGWPSARGTRARRAMSTTEAGEATPQVFPAIVGLGSSAGGLDALRRFFNSAPSDSGMAFVLVQHLDPTHPSMIADLLGRAD